MNIVDKIKSLLDGIFSGIDNIIDLLDPEYEDANEAKLEPIKIDKEQYTKRLKK